MSASTSTPPPEAPCLYRPYASSQRGGTRIATEVEDLAEHLSRMRSPDGYRPSRCPTCGHAVMHAHDSRTRLCSLGGAPPVIGIARHRCAHPKCGARWQTLPAFLARHLHFDWARVQSSCAGTRPRAGRVPSSWTVRRWCTRLSSCASRLVGLLADGGRPLRTAVRTRRELLDALDVSFATVAAWVQALMAGVRLM